MTLRKSEQSWRVIGKSIRGASHVRKGTANQDAIGWRPESGIGLPLFLAVSDGHGSSKCFRSDVGASLAVACCLNILNELSKDLNSESNASLLKHTIEERLPREIVMRWKAAVNQHVSETPFSDDELAFLESNEGPSAREMIKEAPSLAYGATLLSVLVTDEFIVYLRLGDGDILTVSANGEVANPLPKDERLMGNETTSLCGKDAWNDCQLSFQLKEPPPALILVSTDGYANSFRDEESFLKVGRDILEMMRADGLESIEPNLTGWLTEASEAGSGDDITLGIICSGSVGATVESKKEESHFLSK